MLPIVRNGRGQFARAQVALHATHTRASRSALQTLRPSVHTYVKCRTDSLNSLMKGQILEHHTAWCHHQAESGTANKTEAT